MRDLTVSEDQMLQAVREIFQGKSKKMPLRRALYTIYVRQAIDAGRRQADRGQKIPHEKVMEDMWNQINTGLSGHRRRNRSFRKSSLKF
jgi:predicted transcriptional regulator